MLPGPRNCKNGKFEHHIFMSLQWFLTKFCKVSKLGIIIISEVYFMSE